MSELQAEQSLGFITGIWMSEYKEKFKTIVDNKKTILIIVIIFTFLGGFALALKQLPLIRIYEGTPIYNIVQLLIKWPLSIAIIFGCYRILSLVLNSFILFAGVISYELYLVHFPFYEYVGQKLWPAVVLWIGAFFVSWLFNKINNRINKLIV